MDFLETDLEEIIFKAFKENPDWYEKNIGSAGGSLYRQVNIGAYGRIDLMHIDFEYPEKNEKRMLYIQIYELKLGTLKLEHLVQISRYMRGVETYLNTMHLRNTNLEISGNIICKDIPLKEDFVYLLDYTDSINVKKYHYTLEGLKIGVSEYGYKLVQPNFNGCKLGTTIKDAYKTIYGGKNHG